VGRPIRTGADMAAHARERDAILDKHIRLMLGFSTTKILTWWRGRPGFPIQSGNLQHSVGVDRRIAASKQTIGWLPPQGDAIDVEALVRRRARGYSIVLGAGMEYAKDVADRMGLYVDEVLLYARFTFQENFPKAVENARRELEARG
jgi:hypothetical protein